jgi:hypothetical protein
VYEGYQKESRMTLNPLYVGKKADMSVPTGSATLSKGFEKGSKGGYIETLSKGIGTLV